MIHMEYYLVVSTIMMFAGIYGFFTRRNTLAILISVELMLNALRPIHLRSNVLSEKSSLKTKLPLGK